MKLVLEMSPYVLDAMIVLQLASALDVFDSIIYHPLADLGENHRVDTFVMVLRKHSDQKGVNRVVFP